MPLGLGASGRRGTPPTARADCSPAVASTLQHVGAVGEAADRQRHAQLAVGQRRRRRASRSTSPFAFSRSTLICGVCPPSAWYSISTSTRSVGPNRVDAVGDAAGLASMARNSTMFRARRNRRRRQHQRLLGEIGHRLRLHPAIDDLARRGQRREADAMPARRADRTAPSAAARPARRRSPAPASSPCRLRRPAESRAAPACRPMAPGSAPR